MTAHLSAQELTARKRLCLPLDGIETLEALQERVRELSPYIGLFKIGKESFTRFGPEAVRMIRAAGSDVFLDLKYHDIPATVKGAVRAAVALDVAIVNVHASGGRAMLEAAVKGLGNSRTKLIAVTVLTSLDDAGLHELGVQENTGEHVLRLAKLAADVGLHGIVCSAQDLAIIRQSLPSDFLYVTPGISGVGGAVGGDQKRVMTPGAALQAGSGILVAGRAITGFDTVEGRCNAAKEILADMARNV